MAETLPRETTHEQWVNHCLAWVDVSDAVLRLPGISKGADIETARAREKGIPVFYSMAELMEWANSSKA